MHHDELTESRRQAVIDAAESFIAACSNGIGSLIAFRTAKGFYELESAVADLRHGRDAIAKEHAEMAKPTVLADGLWNVRYPATGCWALTGGKWFWVSPSVPGKVSECDGFNYMAPSELSALAPNTWPIPEAAKAKLRELGLKLDDEEAEMQSTLSRPDRFEGE